MMLCCGRVIAWTVHVTIVLLRSPTVATIMGDDDAPLKKVSSAKRS